MSQPHDIRERRRLVEQLRRAKVYREYEKAFRDCTGLPLSLHSGECFGLTHQDDVRENPFCAMLAKRSRTCAACLALQQRLTQAVEQEPASRQCYAGLTESAVAVRVGERIVAYLQTGQILLWRPSPARLRWLVQQLKAHGIEDSFGRFTAAYLRGRIMPRKQYDAVLRLLAIFAQQLGEFSNQLILQEAPVEQPAIARARAYIAEHHTEELALTEVARAVNMSRYHFCKIFHRSTGMTFTDYLARVRVEHVRRRLLDPATRISEAAYAAGFQSLSQFSRVFRRIVGEPPSTFRLRPELAKSA